MRDRPMFRRLGVLFVLSLVALGACGGTPDEADLQKWASNEAGFPRLGGVVKDKKQPLEVRVRALEIVVEKNQELRVRGMIELIADQAERKTVAGALVDKLQKHIVAKDPAQLASKDAILLLLRYLPPDQLDKVQKVIADWAFADITWETPAADLKAKLESRISASQIADLGPYGLESAAILLANGFIAEQMVRYLSGSSAPQAKPLLIKAFRRFIPAFLNVNPFYLDAIRKTGDPDGAAFLFELYQDTRLDQKARDACFSVGAMMLDAPTIKGQPEAAKAVVAQLMKIGAAAGAGEDRWLAAANLLAVTGGGGFADVVALFKDDKSYSEPEATGNSMLDLCFAMHDEGKPEAALPGIEKVLAGGNRVQKVIAVLCAKTLSLDYFKPTLATMAQALGTKTDVSVADFLGSAEPTADGKKQPLTLGFLAQNAIEGMGLLGASNLDKLTPEQRKARHFVIVVEYRELGETYAKHVEERYAESLKKPAPK